MAYKSNELFEEAIKQIREKKLFFIEDVVAFLPCSKPTFYDHFKIDSDEFNTIKEELEKNRIAVKANMRKKWYDSDNATLQVALMKLIGTDEERKNLSPSYIDKTEVKIDGEGMRFNITRNIIGENENSGE